MSSPSLDISRENYYEETNSTMKSNQSLLPISMGVFRVLLTNLTSFSKISADCGRLRAVGMGEQD